MKKIFILLSIFFSVPSFAQSLYFPPISSSATWDTLSPKSLGWCTEKVDSLYDFLGHEQSKAFIVLKDGKIVLEKYFGTFTQDSVWYWASAGKTITAFLVGKAQEESKLKLSDTSSKYLGKGWTSATSTQEDKITIRHQLTMTSGLDDGVSDNHCTLPICLQYLKDAGTRWAYHNAPYTLLEKVIENATGENLNVYTQNKLKIKTGITGLWSKVDYNNIFFSKARSMARFGLLIQNKGIWDKDTLLYDTAYIHQMLNTSQTLNNSYGYLWWLNGKSSYMLPTTQFVFSGYLAPFAPSDMFAAIGKNGQILSIAPSKGLIWIRMGESASTTEVSTDLCNRIWEQLNKVLCSSTNIVSASKLHSEIKIYPNPTNKELHVSFSEQKVLAIEVQNILGQIVYKSQVDRNAQHLAFELQHPGLYLLKIEDDAHQISIHKIVVSN